MPVLEGIPMNCVQCGEELLASAKFCKKCGCKVEAAVPAAALAAVSRGIPVASAPAYHLSRLRGTV